MRTPIARAVRGPGRAPLPERRRAARRRARAVVARRAHTRLSPEQRARDPLPVLRPARRASRVAIGAAFVAGSLAVHAALVLGSLVGGAEPGRRERVRQEVKIEVLETKVLPPPPPVVTPEPERPAPRPPRLVRLEPPPPAPPRQPLPDKAPPPRVVGLSLESTVEGGGGPAFGVGNTRLGATAERAAPPSEAPADAATGGATAAAPARPGANRAASNLPLAGVRYTLPRRRREVKPRYPATLQSQGIEAQVTLMIALDETGKVTGVKVVREAPYPEFDEEARKAALAEEWEPATRDGIPIPYTVSFVARFRLED